MRSGRRHFPSRKWDGSGYPYGLKGENIPLIGRLMAMADVYDALGSDRPYKKAFPHEVARNIILGEAGKHFDPVLVDVFSRVEGKFRDVSENFSKSQSVNKTAALIQKRLHKQTALFSRIRQHDPL